MIRQRDARAWWKACVAAMCLSRLAAAAPGGDIWSAFLDTPSDESYARVVQTIRKCPPDRCQVAKPDEDQVSKLAQLMATGDRRAITLGFLALELVNPGDVLEQLCRSLGEVADRHPRDFLEEAWTQRLTPGAMKCIVLKTPEAAVDDTGRQRAALEGRIHSLARVKDRRLLPMRDAAIDLLRRSLASPEMQESP